MFAGSGELLDMSVHICYGQTATALLSPADYILQTRQHSLQFRVQVATGICTTERTCQTSTKSESIAKEREAVVLMKGLKWANISLHNLPLSRHKHH